MLAAAEWGPLNWPRRIAAIAVATGAAALSVRLVEDPVRHSRYFSALSWRSLSLGLAMCVLVIRVGWDLRASSIRLDGGVQAAAPQLATATTTLTPSALAAAPTSTVAPTTTAAVATSTDPSPRLLPPTRPLVSSLSWWPRPSRRCAGVPPRSRAVQPPSVVVVCP